MNATLKDIKQCPNCGKAMPEGALAGFCPACLLLQGAATEAGEPAPSIHFVPPPLEEVARLFPQLEILGLLGAGGMGAVYKARQTALDRTVALKILPAATSGGANPEERFNREARALARLNHPNIVTVYEFGESGGLRYFIMEFVDGANLRQLEKVGRLSAREALQIIPQICDALQYAHDEGVVHRDIKPENVLVDRKGRVKIADFGLAKILGQDTEALRLTREGQVMGTPHYMAPEQVERPLAVDHRVDIYSLGVVFYEMLTGDLPLGKFAPPSRKVQVDVRLDEVVLRALENDPARRYQHASEVKTRVATIAETPSPKEAEASEPEQRFLGWLGFAVVAVRSGVRAVHWKGALVALAVTFGLLSIAFAFVTVFTDRPQLPFFAHRWLPGWIGIKGWPSLVARIVIAALIVSWGVRHAWRSQREAEAVPRNSVMLTSSTRQWRIGRRVVVGSLMVLAWCVFQVQWLTPWLQSRFDDTHRGKLAAATALNPSESKWRFGSATDRTFSGLIDFDTGQIGELPTDDDANPIAGLAKNLAWIQKHGYDALVGQDKLETFGMRVVELKSRDLDALTRVDLLRQLEERGSFTSELRPITGKVPAIYGFRTREGGLGWLLILALGNERQEATIRYNLLPAPGPMPVAATTNIPSPAALAEPPQLRFLAWQDEWKTNGSLALRLSDGSPATNQADLDLMRTLSPTGMDLSATEPSKRNAKFLHFWFSHPLFDRQSLVDVTLLDADATLFPAGAGGSAASSARAASEGPQKLGWVMATLCPGQQDPEPRVVTVRLRYAIGPLQNAQEAARDFTGGMSLTRNAQLNGIGQNARGEAFVAIAVDTKADAAEQFGALAVMPDGRELQPSGSFLGGNSDGRGVNVQRFEFPVPLSEIVKFRIGTRPIRSIEWKNVAL
jgi:predicted Ser/Thr protein kinase